MINRYFDGVIPEYHEPADDLTKKLFEDVKEKLAVYEEKMDSFDITMGANAAMELIDLGNKYFDNIAPWTQAKNNNIELLKESLYSASELLRIGSILLNPIMPTKTIDALNQENVPEELRTFDSIKEIGKLSGIHINSLSPLFPRLKKDEEIKFLTDLIDGK